MFFGGKMTIQNSKRVRRFIWGLAAFLALFALYFENPYDVEGIPRPLSRPATAVDSSTGIAGYDRPALEHLFERNQ